MSYFGVEEENMTTRQITAVAFRVIAIYIFYTAVVCFPFYLRFSWQYLSNKAMGTLGIAVAVCAGAAAAWFTWRFATSLAKDMRDTEHESIATQFTKEQLEQVLLRILGLYVFATHLRPAVDNFLRLSFTDPTGGMADLRLVRVALVVDVALLCAGVLFFLKPRFWQEKFSAWETKGQQSSSNNTSDGIRQPADGSPKPSR